MKKALEMIQAHIKELDNEISKSMDSHNKAILQQAKSTALLSLAKILVG